MIVLAMDVNQSVTKFCQSANGDRAVIQQATVFAGPGNRSPYHKLSAIHINVQFT